MEMPGMKGTARGRPVMVSLWGQDSAPAMRALSVHPTRCWNAFAADSGCSQCRDACMANCIRLAPAPSVDADKCESCGLCTVVCPTGAFEFPRMYQEGRLRASAEMLAGMEPEPRVLIISCQGISGTRGAGESNTNRPLVCLVALDAGHLLGLRLRGAEELLIDAGRCSGCRVAGGLEQLQKLVKRTQALLESLGLSGKAALSTDRREWKDRAAASIFLFSEISYTRREFFARFRQRSSANGAKKILHSRAAAEEAPAATDDARAAASKLPENRKLLLRLMGSGEAFAAAPNEPRWLPMRIVKVRQDCRLCESCARNCPGGALVRNSDAKGVSLSFHLYHCLGCSLCEKICPHGLLESRPLGVEDFPLQRRRVLCERSKIKCADCERPFLPTDDLDVCSTCQRLQKLDQEILGTLAW